MSRLVDTARDGRPLTCRSNECIRVHMCTGLLAPDAAVQESGLGRVEGRLGAGFSRDIVVVECDFEGRLRGLGRVRRRLGAQALEPLTLAELLRTGGGAEDGDSVLLVVGSEEIHGGRRGGRLKQEGAGGSRREQKRVEGRRGQTRADDGQTKRELRSVYG